MKFHLLVLTLTVPTFASLGGCATMNKDECLTVDWRTGRLKAEIRQLESDQVVYQRDLDDYQAQLPQR